MSAVPNTNIFSLWDVLDAVYGHHASENLSDAFTDSVASYFDPTYGSKTMSPKTMLGCRNYHVAGIACGTEKSYLGGETYPTSTEITLGSALGTVPLYYNFYDIPDRIIVIYNGNIAIDTQYRGHSNFDYGGVDRFNFRNSLIGEFDPVYYPVTYPNFTYWPDDGYPRVYAPNSPLTFYKADTFSLATVNVYAPLPLTQWTFTLGCPV